MYLLRKKLLLSELKMELRMEEPPDEPLLALDNATIGTSSGAATR